MTRREVVEHLVRAWRRLLVFLVPLKRVPPHSLASAGVGLLLIGGAVTGLATGAPAGVVVLLAAGLIVASLPGFGVKMFLRLGVWKAATITWWALGFGMVAGMTAATLSTPGRSSRPSSSS